ncbi:MAG: DsbA family protein [Candidatus Woesearchaeota archaeon]
MSRHPKHTKHENLKSEKGEKISEESEKKEKVNFKQAKNIKNHIGRHIKHIKKNSKYILYALGIIVAVALFLFLKNYFSGMKTAYKSEVDIYVMSMCPYGAQALNGLIPAVKELNSKIREVKLNVYFIASEQNGVFSSLHGEEEVKEDLRQVCVIKYYPKNWQDYVYCIAQNYYASNKAPKDVWQECAKNNKIDVKKIEKCANSEEGKKLLSESIKKSEEAQAQGSPTIYINGNLYYGGRDILSFKRAICTNSNNSLSECANIPKPKRTNMIVLNDNRCKECDVTQLVQSLESLFYNLNTTYLDYSSEEGKKLYNDLQVIYLPAIIFDDSVKEGEGYSTVQRYLTTLNDNKHYLLRIGASFDPTKEICDNKIDDDNNGMIDCKDPYCSEQIICREEVKNKIDLFVMSMCPYGVTAERALKDFLNVVKGVNVSIHFIASENADGTFSSLHGAKEVDEDIRQVCIMKYYPAKYFDYMWCQADYYLSGKDISTTYQDCLQSNSMDLLLIKKCAEGKEGKELLRENMKLTDALGIGASPTWLVNNKYEFSGLDASTIQKNFCAYNNVSGCEKQINGSATQTTTGSCG